MADNVSVTFGGEIAGLKAAASQATDQINQFVSRTKTSVGLLASPFEKLQQSILAIAAIAAGGAVFKSFVDEATTAAGEVLKLSKSLGINTDAANVLRVQLRGTGNTVDDYVSASLRMDRQVRQNEDTIKKTGMATRDANGQFLNGQQLMVNAISTLKQYKEGTDRNIASQVIFGRGAGDTASLLKLNSESMQRATKDLTELGLTVTPQAMANSKAYKESMHELELSFQGIKKAIGEAVLPYLTSFANWFRQQAPTIITNMKETMKSVIDWAFDTAKAFIDFVHSALDGVISLMAGWTLVKSSLGMIDELAADTTMRRLADMSDSLKNLRERAIAAVDSIHAVVTAGGPNSPIPSSPAPGTKSAVGLINDKGKDEELAAAMKNIDGQVKLLRDGLEQKKVIYQSEVEIQKITENQKFALTQQAVQQTTAAEISKLQTEMTFAGMSLAQKQEVENKIKQLKEKSNTELIRLDSQSIAAQKQMWSGYLSDITGAFHSQLSGLLTGTMTFTQAFKNAMLDLTLKIVGYFEKMGIEWAATQLGMATAAQTGALQQAAATQEAMALTLPARIAKFTSDITAMSAATFAGIFANLAPILGPAAAGPAAAGQATVLTQLAAVPKLDVGGLVLSDGFAMIHRGETVTPAAQVDTPFKGAQGGGPDLHFHGPFTGGAGEMDVRKFAKKLQAFLAVNPSYAPA